MVTASVIAGRAEAGAIVRTPGPGMLKVIVSSPGRLLARVIASRSVVTKSLAIASPAPVTTSDNGSRAR